MQYHILRAFQTEQETSEYSLSSTTSVSHQEQLNICSTQTVALHVTSMLNVTRMPYEKCVVIMHYLLQELITQMHKWQAGYHQLT